MEDIERAGEIKILGPLFSDWWLKTVQPTL
jgi:hypothetical protein